MPLRFSWDESYSVGNEMIDAQHQHLFSLVNALGDEITEQAVKQVIMELYKYTRIHFTAEERLMRAGAFPLLSEHKLLHDNLIDQLNTISRQDFSKEEAVFDLRKFVFTWLVNHILEEDMRYAAHLRMRQVT